MNAAWVTSSLLALLPQSPSASPPRTLAQVPEGFALSEELVRTAEPSTYRRGTSLRFASDGSLVAYVARRGDQAHPVVGSELGPAYSDVSTPCIAGGRAFFVVSRVTGENTASSWVWVDGKEVEREDWIGELAVSPNGKRVAYWTFPGARYGDAPTPEVRKHYLAVATRADSGQWFVARGKAWQGCVEQAPLFDATGAALLAGAFDGKAGILIERRQRETVACEGGVSIRSFAASRDLRATAIEGTNDNSQRSVLLFRQKRVGSGFPSIGRPVVDAGGKHVAYVVAIADGRSVAIDDEKTPTGRWDHVFELAFDPAGEELAQVVNRGGSTDPQYEPCILGGEHFVVVRALGRAEPRADGPKFGAIRDLVWDAKGERLAYSAQDARGWRIVCGDVQSEPYADVGAAVFTARGIEFGARDGRELLWCTLPLP